METDEAQEQSQPNEPIQHKAADIQRQAYQLTINNPEENGFPHDIIKRTLVERFATLQYFCLADEIGEQGTYHTHIYAFFGSRVRFSTIKKHFPPAHIEAANGTHKQNRNYVRKEGRWADSDKSETSVPGTFEEWGTMPTSKGKDVLMDDLYNMVSDGLTDGEILAENHDYVKYLDTIARLRKTLLIEKYKGHRRLDLKVHYISGATGTGKTRGVLDKEGDANVYRVTDYDHPFDSYDMQPVLCLDEFRSSLKMTLMLDLLDIYPLELPARYANRVACYETVYIISNWALEDQYREVQDSHPATWKALLRRIHTVTVYDSNGQIHKYHSVQDYLNRDEPPEQQRLVLQDWMKGEAEDMADGDLPF